MANKINPFDPNVISGLYKVHFPDFAFWLQKTQSLGHPLWGTKMGMVFLFFKG